MYLFLGKVIQDGQKKKSHKAIENAELNVNFVIKPFELIISQYINEFTQVKRHIHAKSVERNLSMDYLAVSNHY